MNFVTKLHLGLNDQNVLDRYRPNEKIGLVTSKALNMCLAVCRTGPIKLLETNAGYKIAFTVLSDINPIYGML